MFAGNHIVKPATGDTRTTAAKRQTLLLVGFRFGGTRDFVWSASGLARTQHELSAPQLLLGNHDDPLSVLAEDNLFFGDYRVHLFGRKCARVYIVQFAYT